MLRRHLPTVLRAPNDGGADGGGTGGGTVAAPEPKVEPKVESKVEPKPDPNKDKLTATRVVLDRTKAEAAVQAQELADTKAKLKEFEDAKTAAADKKARDEGDFDALAKKKDDELTKANADLATAKATIAASAAEKRTAALVNKIVADNKGADPVIVAALLDRAKKDGKLEAIDPETDKLEETAKTATAALEALSPASLKPQGKPTGGGVITETDGESVADARLQAEQTQRDHGRTLGLRLNDADLL